MATALPALRRTLEMMPSPVPESPGLLVRDPFRYARGVLILPPALVPCLLLFDGRHDEGDLREILARLTGTVEVGEVVEHLVDTLSGGGFLEDDVFEGIRAERHRSFAEEATRTPLHAGAAYPEDPDDLRALLARYLAEAPKAAAPAGPVVAVAAPHVSPEGGWRSYAAAYRALPPDAAGRTFVILGTSHYGEPERFGLTHKPFRTPLGQAHVAPELVDRLAGAAGEAACLEDYCHAIEHSIEFQVLFLQHLYGADVHIVPILCGPFARATVEGGSPEDDAGVARFLDALGAMAADEPGLLWVAGVDMAHVGRRYGDRFAARAEAGRLLEVGQQDRARLGRLAEGDAAGFWALVREGSDPLRWCGSSPLYTLVRAVRPRAGAVLHYEQWNIDPESVVSCAGLAFTR